MCETLTKRVDIGVQNKERIISDVLKNESYRSLNRVKKIDNNTLEIEFSEQDFRFKEKEWWYSFLKKEVQRQTRNRIKDKRTKRQVFIYNALDRHTGDRFTNCMDCLLQKIRGQN